MNAKFLANGAAPLGLTIYKIQCMSSQWLLFALASHPKTRHSLYCQVLDKLQLEIYT